ncbi:angiotensin-converting enzyme, partial [Clarias magur]
ISANLEKQAFTEVWGNLAKQLFNDALMDTFTDPELKALIKKINVLGPANLPATEREK